MQKGKMVEELKAKEKRKDLLCGAGIAERR